jgi:hypothetical protein
MGTYTQLITEEYINLLNFKRIQISGPLLMPWYFIFAKKG